MAAPDSATCPADVSTGPPNADVIMASDDVSVDLVNVDQVNWVHVRVRSTCQWHCATDRWVPLIRLGMTKGKGWFGYWLKLARSACSA